MSPTTSTDEALALLNEFRSHLIEEARSAANRLLLSNGSTTVRDVLEKMKVEGDLLSQARLKGIKDYWLGTIFRHKSYKWTGDVVYPPVADTTNNLHASAAIKVWVFSDFGRKEHGLGPAAPVKFSGTVFMDHDSLCRTIDNLQRVKAGMVKKVMVGYPLVINGFGCDRLAVKMEGDETIYPVG